MDKQKEIDRTRIKPDKERLKKDIEKSRKDLNEEMYRQEVEKVRKFDELHQKRKQIGEKIAALGLSYNIGKDGAVTWFFGGNTIDVFKKDKDKLGNERYDFTIDMKWSEEEGEEKKL